MRMREFGLIYIAYMGFLMVRRRRPVAPSSLLRFLCPRLHRASRRQPPGPTAPRIRDLRLAGPQELRVLAAVRPFGIGEGQG